MKKAYLSLIIGLMLAGSFTLVVNFEHVRADIIRVPDDYSTISAALSAASIGDTVAVRAGTYRESFSPLDGVAILGGYDPAFSLRDPALYETVLESSGRVAACYGCVGSTAVLDGFTMTGGGGQDGGVGRGREGGPRGPGGQGQRLRPDEG